jgi:hypothetical protein
MRRPAGQMVARVENHYKHEMDQLAEDGCKIHYDMHPVQKVAPPAVQSRCHDNLDVEVNHGIDRGSF